jgi:hypothetical protein
MRQFEFIGDVELAEIASLIQMKDGVIRFIYGIEIINEVDRDAVSYAFYNGRVIFGSSRNVNPPKGMSAFIVKEDDNPMFTIEGAIETIALMQPAYLAQGTKIEEFLKDCYDLDKVRKQAACGSFFEKYRELLRRALTA